jgi:hypothetical protein
MSNTKNYLDHLVEQSCNYDFEATIELAQVGPMWLPELPPREWRSLRLRAFLEGALLPEQQREASGCHAPNPTAPSPDDNDVVGALSPVETRGYVVAEDIESLTRTVFRERMNYARYDAQHGTNAISRTWTQAATPRLVCEAARRLLAMVEMPHEEFLAAFSSSSTAGDQDRGDQ